MYESLHPIQLAHGVITQPIMVTKIIPDNSCYLIHWLCLIHVMQVLPSLSLASNFSDLFNASKPPPWQQTSTFFCHSIGNYGILLSSSPLSWVASPTGTGTTSLSHSLPPLRMAWEQRRLRRAWEQLCCESVVSSALWWCLLYQLIVWVISLVSRVVAFMHSLVVTPLIQVPRFLVKCNLL